MGFYVVVRENPYFERFSYVQDVNDYEDLPEPMVMPTQPVMDEGRWTPMYDYGVMIPLRLVRKSILRVQKMGIDMEGLKG